jgi:hypothetical protein
MLELPNMDEADRVHFFIKGLKPEIRMHVTLRKTATLHEAVELAIHADGLLWGMNKGRKPPNYVPRSNFPVQRQPADSGPTPMELGSMEQEEGGQTELNLVEDERKPLRCYYCHRAGHRIADCYQRKADEEKQQKSQPFKSPAQQEQQRPPFKGKGGKRPSCRSTN